MSGGNFLQQWIGEFCAPVVVTIASAEAEKICLKNGLLLHELLSCFGHLDGLNASIRAGNQTFPLPDAHIRFERGTEVRLKTSENIEELLVKSFVPYDVDRLPNSVAELKASPPTAWTRTIEQIVVRSLSFSEHEMISQPTIFLTVVATTDRDPVAAMQELSSIHNMPICLTNGQYDPTVQRVFVLLDDSGEKKAEALNALRALTAQFPASQTKLLTINSFSKSQLNLQQPDMWGRFLIPKYFSHHAPTCDPNDVPQNPNTLKPVIGARLSVDDFMKLRDFCVWLFNEQIVPVLERRIANLSRVVNDSRKGVKNVLKSFWRKARDETDSSRGGVKYRFDKIETQTLLLADTSFAIKDYETALSMYRLVKDDYKADKSIIHYTHTLIMIAICQMLTEPQKYKEIYGVLDTVSQCMLVGVEWPHALAYLALLSSEIYTYHHSARSPLDSARILLQASSGLVKYPLLSSLLMERAAIYFLQAYQVRKYVFHAVLSGMKLHKCGTNPAIHATVCFAAAMLMMEKGHWGDIKVKLLRFLAQEFRSRSREGSQKSLIFMLKTLTSVLSDAKDVGYGSSLSDAVSVLNEVIGDSGWGMIHVQDNWKQCSFRDIVDGKLPLGAVDITKEDISKSKAVVCGLPVPEIDVDSVTILELVNGYSLHDIQQFSSDLRYDRDLLQLLLDVEKQHAQEQTLNSSSPVLTVDSSKESNAGKDAADVKSLEELLCRAEMEYKKNWEIKKKAAINAGDSLFPSDPIKIPTQENILVEMKVTNKLPTELTLTQLQLETSQNDHFTIVDETLCLSSECEKTIVLKITPNQTGRYSIESIRWNLSECFTVVQPIQKKGPLLQRTMAQRANNERGKDRSMIFDVMDSRALLTIHLEGMSSEVLEGQILPVRITLTNQGSAVANNIYLKLNEPIAVIESQGKLLNFTGSSSTVVHLSDVTIAANETLQLEAWIRFHHAGNQKFSILASYDTLLSSADQATTVSAKSTTRNSYICRETKVLACVTAHAKVVTRTSSIRSCSLLTETTNHLKQIVLSQHAEQMYNNSLGQILYPDLDERYHDLKPMHVEVIGQWMLGNGKLPDSADSSLKLIPIAPNERYTECKQLKIINPVTKQGSATWLLPLPEDVDFTASLAPPSSSSSTSASKQIEQVIEQYMCAHYSHRFHKSRLVEAKMMVELEELEAEMAGPRSIAEVRRARQKVASEKLEGLEEDEEFDTSNPTHTFNTLQDIIQYELRNNSTCMVMVWICKWQTKIRFGMNFIPHIPISLRHVEKRSVNPAAAIQLAIQHPLHVNLLPNQSHVIVDVVVTIRSYHSERLVLALQALSYNHGDPLAEYPINQDVTVTQVSYEPFCWIDKIHHEGLALSPQGEVTIPFKVQITAAGVYDLNRFKYMVKLKNNKSNQGKSNEIENDDVDEIIEWKHYPGQSLINVTVKSPTESSPVSE